MSNTDAGDGGDPDGVAAGDRPPMHHRIEYFEAMYADADDPWGFDQRWYEHRKYDLTLAALPEPRYRRGLEPGCANGALTQRLATRCDELIAHDLLACTVRRARDRLAGHPNIELHCEPFPQWWPSGTGDLVVWSEVAYYCTPAGLDVAVEALERWLEPGGTVIAVHYTGETDYPLHASDVHGRLDGTGFLDRRTTVVDDRFELVVWRRP